MWAFAHDTAEAVWAVSHELMGAHAPRACNDLTAVVCSLPPGAHVLRLRQSWLKHPAAKGPFVTTCVVQHQGFGHVRAGQSRPLI